MVQNDAPHHHLGHVGYSKANGTWFFRVHKFETKPEAQRALADHMEAAARITELEAQLAALREGKGDA